MFELEKKLLTMNAKREGKFVYGYDSEIERNLIPRRGAMIHYENVPACNYITIFYSAEADTGISILKNGTELKTVPLYQTSGKYRTVVVEAAFDLGDRLTLFKKTNEADAAISYIILHQSDPTIVILAEENVVLNKPLTVLGEDGWYPAYKAVDGIINNKQDFWRGTNRTGTATSKEDPGWMIADLKGAYHIKSMTIQLPTYWGGRYQDIRVLVFVDDGKTYKILSDWQTYEFKSAEVVTISIPEDGFDATNLKLEFANNTGDPGGAQIGEWTVIGVRTTIQPEYPFTDVSKGDWFYKAVKFVYECGCMTGTSDSLFAPDASLARDMVVTTLYRIEGKPVSAYNGIVNGYANGSFGPGDKINREQMG